MLIECAPQKLLKKASRAVKNCQHLDAPGDTETSAPTESFTHGSPGSTRKEPRPGLAGMKQTGQSMRAAMAALNPGASALAGDDISDLLFREGLDTGIAAWEFKADHAIGAPPFHGPGGEILVLSGTNTLYAVKEGKLLWQFPAEGMQAASPAYGCDGTCFIDAGDKGYSAVKEGKTLWQVSIDMDHHTLRTGNDGIVIVQGKDRKLHVQKDGEDLWSYPTGVASAPPVQGADGTIYVVNTDSMLCAVKNGEKLWEYQNSDVVTFPPCPGDDGTVYMSSWDNHVRAIKDGKELWDFRAEHPLSAPPALGEDGTLYVVTEDGTISALKDGKQLWLGTLNDRTLSSPGPAGAIAPFQKSTVIASPCPGPDGTVFVGDVNGTLHAYREGMELWRFQAGGGITSAPCPGPDGTIYVGSDDGKLYAVVPPQKARLKDGVAPEDSGEDQLETHGDWLIIDEVRLRVHP